MAKASVFIILLCSTFFYHLSNAQSPYLSVKFSMDSLQPSSVNYKIEMKICELKSSTGTKDWFSYEVSKIKFDTVTAANISCGNYLENGGGLEVVSGRSELKPYNEFTFGNQVFAWEQFLVFRIENASSQRYFPPMYVVFPVRYKSFVTHISVSDVVFQSGKIVFVQSETAKKGEGNLMINVSLKKVKGIGVKDFKLKEIL